MSALNKGPAASQEKLASKAKSAEAAATQRSQPGQPNYISLGASRVKTMATPAWSFFSEMSASQRKFMLVAAAVVFFWPLLLVALNLPWMLTAGAVAYALSFGTGKLYSDARDAAKEHLHVDVEERANAARTLFEQTDFTGKELVIDVSGKAWQYAQLAYKTVLLFCMNLVDCIVTVLLKMARTINGYGAQRPGASPASQAAKKPASKPVVA